MKTTLLLAAALVASFLLISAYQTTATTIPTNDNEGRMSSRCKGQMRWEKMQHCQQHLRSEMDVLRFPNAGNQACCLRECCDMLQDMDKECVCEALRILAEEEAERMAREGEGRRLGRVVLRRAMQLPQRCGMRSQRCETQYGGTTSTY